MTETGQWLGQLETEIARELGQPVTVQAGGESPEPSGSECRALQLPGARLVLAVDREGLASFLVEARLIEQPEPETAIELWGGILDSVAARLGGTAGDVAVGEGFPSDPCAIRVGEATIRMAIRIEGVMSDSPQRNAGAAKPARAGNYDLLLEVELDAAVRFGARELELKELLELGPGDVVELDRHPTDLVDLIVGDKIVARGEVVLVNGNFGLRVTDVAEPLRRLESIRCLF